MSARRPRVYLGGVAPSEGSAALDAEESHHLLRVLRARVGDEVVAFDGAGGEWNATIEDAARDTVRLRVSGPTGRRAEPPIRVALIQALVRPEKLEYILQKGTEIGLSAFVALACERAEAPAPSPSRLARYRRVLVEAAKQSGRLVVPTLTVAAWPPAAGASVVLDPAEGVPPFASFLAGPKRSEVSIAVGPEGGLTPAEIEDLEARGAARASLGPRVLRAETAGVVAGALLLHAWGDLGAI
jgi:16S rRNA (uracil1498-N3)-methyltransferase